jgi:hypothetical protein
MTVLTILNHGTDNSTDTQTSDGFVLVISKIASLLGSPANFILNEGAGTQKLRDTGVVSPRPQGIFNGQGVEDNVRISVDWVKRRIQELRPSGLKVTAVNLAGHSRGSITCYKIANKLSVDLRTHEIPINIFAIDPVPGNTGNFITRNGANYENIVLSGNVWRGNSFLMLAESEHRLVFRAYIDALYGARLPNHEFDTMPGTHGGINMLQGPEHEAADLVLSRALEFLKANGSPLKKEADAYILGAGRRHDLYLELMGRIKKYKAHASVNPAKKHSNSWEAVKNFAMSGLQVDKHRLVNVNHDKANFAVDPERNGPALQGAQKRKNFHGLTMNEAIDRMSGAQAHGTRAHRFFCNFDHEKIFGDLYPELAAYLSFLESETFSTSFSNPQRMDVLHRIGSEEFARMRDTEQAYFMDYLEKRGVDSHLFGVWI